MGHLPTPIPSGHNRSARSPEENNTSEALKDELSRNQPVEHPRSPTPLERYFDSPEEASSPAEAAAQLLRGIDLSEWEPTPSIHRTPHSDRPSDDPFGLWYNSTEPMEDEDEDEDEGTLYKTQASRVRKDEDEYGWELLQKFIRISTWTSPAQLGRQINRLVRSPPSNWVAKLTKFRFSSFMLTGVSGTGCSIWARRRTTRRCRTFVGSGEKGIGGQEISIRPRHCLPSVKKQSTRRRFELHPLK